MITWQDYMKGRDDVYRADCTIEIMRNASRTIDVVNKVLAAMEADGVDIKGVKIASGWRPPAVNDHTANAAHTSKHLTAEACDIADFPDRRLCRWALRNEEKLRALGVHIEDPRYTPSWLHVQTVPPASGKFCFIPSSAPPLVAALPEQLHVG